MNVGQITRSSIDTVTMVAGEVIDAVAQPPDQKSSPAELVAALHIAFGNNHARAVHAKGIILEGVFTPNKSAATLTRAAHLQKEASEVMLRFSDFTGIPDIPDNIGAANPRGFAIKFTMPGGSTTDIVAHSFNGFPTADSDQFRELLLAIAASGADAARPTQLDQFLETHPVAKTFLTTQHNPASYAAINYFGVNAFKFTNEEGAAHFIRYRFIPDKGEQLLTSEQLAMESPDYLQKEIASRIAKEPAGFQMYAQIAEEGDDIENPSVTWSETRKQALLGVIEIQKLASNTMQADKQLSFIPNNLPDGIATADPMLNFRSNAYPISVKERQ
jgi:catalase